MKKVDTVSSHVRNCIYNVQCLQWNVIGYAEGILPRPLTPIMHVG